MDPNILALLRDNLDIEPDEQQPLTKKARRRIPRKGTPDRRILFEAIRHGKLQRYHATKGWRR
jgi:hypothetical protein